MSVYPQPDQAIFMGGPVDGVWMQVVEDAPHIRVPSPISRDGLEFFVYDLWPPTADLALKLYVDPSWSNDQILSNLLRAYASSGV